MAKSNPSTDDTLAGGVPGDFLFLNYIGCTFFKMVNCVDPKFSGAKGIF